MRNGLWLLTGMMVATGVALTTAVVHAESTQPSAVVNAEETVYTFVNPNNGSGPTWSHGCTSIARIGDDVFVSEMETGKDVPLLCNTRWCLLKRTPDGWKMAAEAENYKQREPCSLAVPGDKCLYLYVNDSLCEPGTKYGICEPHLLKFPVTDTGLKSTKLSPDWKSEVYYTDHSYRGYAADSVHHELLMLNIDAKTSIQHACLMNSEGNTLGTGSISFPIRSCYPNVALANRAVHLIAVSDIVEPVDEWRQYKFDQTQQHWDYVFRRIYYVNSPDLSKQDFGKPLEITNVDATGGAVSNKDLWISPTGEAFILYTEQEVQSALLRDKFMPGKSITPSLYLAVVKDGQVVERKMLLDGAQGYVPGDARFHQTPDNRLFVLAYVSGKETGNRLIQVLPPVDNAPLIPVPLKQPLGSFALADVRAGNAPSTILDILGQSDANTMVYAQVELK